MSKKLQAVIFDMDGVIVDTFELYYIVNKEVANKLGLAFTKEDNEKFRGISRRVIIEYLVKKSGKKFTEKEIKELGDQKNMHYKKLLHQLNDTAILPGMKEFISTLKKNNIKIAIASSSTNAITVLKKTGIYDYFDYIVDPSTLSKGKPDPEIFIKAADQLGVPHLNCAAIEDGEAGMRGLKLTNMFTLGIGKAVEKEKAHWHVNCTEEITYNELLKRFNR